jgi:hypothetical protein
VSVVWSWTDALPSHLRSCNSTVGGNGEVDSRTKPSCDTATTFGDEGCDGDDSSRSPVGNENAWTTVVNGVVKNSVRESGENSNRRDRS